MADGTTDKEVPAAESPGIDRGSPDNSTDAIPDDILFAQIECTTAAASWLSINDCVDATTDRKIGKTAGTGIPTDTATLSIALVTDMFYPDKGGVETHVRIVGEELCKLGHTVVVITHKYEDHAGMMRLGPLIVYYLDMPVMPCNTIVPTIFTSLCIFKKIFELHNISIVHGHQTVSPMCLEAIYHANHLNIKTVLTDHSVFEFGKFERIIVDGLVSYICKAVDRGICVSETAKINTIARTCIPSDKMCVLPNGIVPKYFYPKRKSSKDTITVLFCARLVFRKGITLLASALPLICKDKRFRVLIIGDGPKKNIIEQTIDEAELHGQVTFIGNMDHQKIPDMMRECDIFLNTSLTETFCMSILEAASCGLLVVSTNVGGIHEVLGAGVIYFAKPTAEDINEQVKNAARRLEAFSPGTYYPRILEEYDWERIAARTYAVYSSIPEKRIGKAGMYSKFGGIGNFLCSMGTWLEYLQIKFFDKLDSILFARGNDD